MPEIEVEEHPTPYYEMHEHMMGQPHAHGVDQIHHVPAGSSSGSRCRCRPGRVHPSCQEASLHIGVQTIPRDVYERRYKPWDGV